MFKGKIINDPIYGFISIDDPLIFSIINHPYYQRLRRIYQMAFASLVYPGAVHTRLAHSLGAYHLMSRAIDQLKHKGIEITTQEEQATKIAILLHDIGHGPFSHALEGSFTPGIPHETMSLLMMEQLNRYFDGALLMAIQIFKDEYSKPFLHQLVSGQLDVDRMDYLNRDSFYTGVSEGVIGYDRIISMLTVHQGRLVVEEKAVYSIEKFLVARRLMYWQVYLHKTVMAAEQMLVKIIQRARQIRAACSNPMQTILHENLLVSNTEILIDTYAQLDDVDVLMALKQWQYHDDVVLATLCTGLLNRNLFRLRFLTQPPPETLLQAQRSKVAQQYALSEIETNYLVFEGQVDNTTYSIHDERIQILFKNGEIKDISQVDNALIQQSLAATVRKYYICWLDPDK